MWAAHTLWQEYQLWLQAGSGASCGEWMIQAVGSDGDVYGNTANTPGTNPQGGCGNDSDAAVLSGWKSRWLGEGSIHR